jgi:photosystem II stability/assembly factor-like uncharacterized protein
MTTIHLAMDDDLMTARSSAGGWHVDLQLKGTQPLCLAADEMRPEHMLCGGYESGLWHSDDGGASWRSEARFEGASVTAVAFSPATPGVVYAGLEPTAFFCSEDGGATWREMEGLTRLPSASTWSFPPRPHLSHVRWITPDPTTPGRLAVCIEAGALVRSLDGGESWMDRVPDGPFDTHTLLAHRLAPGRLYSSAGDGLGSPGRGYNESPDWGDTWRRPDEGLRQHYLWGLAVDPDDPQVMVTSASPSPWAAHNPRQGESSVYRRAGAGAWQEVRDGLPEPRGTTAPVLAASPAQPGAFYAACNRGVYRSADAGASWEPLPLDWPTRYLQHRVNALLITP